MMNVLSVVMRVHNPNFTTIQLEKSVRNRLKEIGAKGETYSRIIARLIPTAHKGGRDD